MVPPTQPQEKLSAVGISHPVAAGKYAFEVFVNGHQAIQGTLSTDAPRKTFHGAFEGHDVAADCTLRAKVDCVITIDGEAD
jgi:hypothetical protein